MKSVKQSKKSGKKQIKSPIKKPGKDAISIKPPRQIELFSKKYDISYVDSLGYMDIKKETFVMGDVDFENHKIRILKKEGVTDEAEVWHTIFHEVFHILKYNLDITFKEEDEEKIIDNLALGIMHFLINNKLL